MRKLIGTITNYCIKKDLIQPEQISWFQYGLEKKIVTLFVGIPFLIIAFAISSWLCAISFFATYFFVRKYADGYHAKTIWGCLFFSLVVELFFIGILPKMLNMPLRFLLLSICFPAVWIFAPYNHPNMHLSVDEAKYCQKHARFRICLSTFLATVFSLTELSEIANGCTIGIAMATTLLCLGYIMNWRNIQWRKTSLKTSLKR